MKKLWKNISIVMSTAVVSVGLISISAYADWKQLGYMGDLNGDGKITIADAVIMSKHILADTPLTSANGYDVEGKYININNNGSFIAEKFLETADINQDGRVDIFDMVILRSQITSKSGYPVYEWEEESSAISNEFITPVVRDLYGSMPSQGEAKIITFYVDFPDCRYSYLPTTEHISDVMFGEADEKSDKYPFESMNAFFERSSKGALSIDGNVYTYTTKNNKSFYENDVWHIELVNEIIEAFDSEVDFSQFDGNNDKVIDTILISVPEAAGDDNWWAAAGQFGSDSYNRADGMDIGHVIVGNCELKSETDNGTFNSSYLHEMGHCMGLPDYYLYNAEDFQGMHGSAGFELMDDAICDFGAVSKLMLGWYKPEQIQVYDKNMGNVTYTLANSAFEDANCLIIPCGELDENYCSEFFVVEYGTMDGNNSSLSNQWWRATGSGVRVYHVSSELNNDPWYNTFMYSSGNDEATNYNNGRRFIRLVGEGTDSTDNYFHAGDIIDSNTNGFNWYDSNGQMTIETGYKITIDEYDGGNYIVTVSEK